MPGKRVLLTGQPGVGKTTLTQKIYGALKERKIPMSGFYTTEVRVQKERLGFDVITLDGKQGVLARKGGQSGAEWKRSPTVGQYSVNVPSFEKIALPTLQDPAENSVLIVDEIGKMELFSKPFIAHVRRLFDQHTGGIIATIPIARGKPLPLVEEIRNGSDVTLFTVTRENRDHLLDEIVTLLMTGIEQ